MLDIDLLVDSDDMYMTSLPEGQSFTWRLLTMKEYRVFSTLRDQGVWHEYQLWDKVFDRCYVGDSRAINGNLPAGIFMSIGRLIMYLSGDCSGEERDEIEAARSQYNQSGVLEVVKRVVLMAFSYKPDELERWTRRKLMRTFVEAEAVLQNRGEYQPLDTSKIMSAEEAAAQTKKSTSVDAMKRENMELRDEFGDRKHALDMHPAELEKKSRQTKKLKDIQLRQIQKSMDSEAKSNRRPHRRR